MAEKLVSLGKADKPEKLKDVLDNAIKAAKTYGMTTTTANVEVLKSLMTANPKKIQPAKFSVIVDYKTDVKFAVKMICEIGGNKKTLGVTSYEGYEKIHAAVVQEALKKCGLA